MIRKTGTEETESRGGRESDIKKRVLISFDYDHDRDYRYLLKPLVANPGSDIDFEDVTPEEIQSYDVARIKHRAPVAQLDRAADF